MGWASDSVLVRLGLRRSNIFAAMLMSFAVSTACMWSYLIATTSLEFLSSPAMLYFVISGCVQPLLARALFYEGITRIGVARAGPLRGTEPLFATIIGVSFLHEEPGALVYMGTILIMTSLWLISGQHDGAAKWRLLDTAFPISCGVGFRYLAKLAQAGTENSTRSVCCRSDRHHGIANSIFDFCADYRQSPVAAHGTPGFFIFFRRGAAWQRRLKSSILSL